MANMFSGNQEKKIPKNFKDCYKTDSITKNLWLWCERLEKWGKILFWILIVIGIIDTIIAGVEAHQFIQEIGAETIEEIREASAEMGIEIPTVFEALVNNLLLWTLYAFLEYCAYHVLALLIGSLATIVQHTKITANITLYNSAKTEGITDDYEPALSKEEFLENFNTFSEKTEKKVKTNKIPKGFKKCSYCGQFSPISLDRCACGCIAFEECQTNDKSENTTPTKCDMCDKTNIKTTYAKIDDDMGVRFRYLCEDCIDKYKAIPQEEK